MSHDQRAAGHARAAGLLAEVGSDEAAAVHLLSTDPAGDQWVVGSLQAAARTTLSRGEPGLAKRFLERARAEPPEDDAEAEVLFELARAAGQAGDEDAIEDLRAAGELARASRLRTLAATELAMALHFSDRGEESIDVAAEALDQIAGEDAELASPLRAILLIGAHHTPRTRSKALGAIRAAVEAAETGDENPVLLAHAAFERAVVDGAVDQGADFAVRAFEGGLIRAVTADFPSVYPPASVLSLADRFDAAERWLTEAIEEARGRGSGRGFAPASAFRAWNRYRRGDLAGAEADARASEEMLSGDHIIRPVALSVLIRVLVDRGRLDEAVEIADGFDPESLHAGLFSISLYYEARAYLDLARGTHAGALAALEPIAAWEAESGYRAEIWVPRRSLEALARSALDQEQQAERLADEAVSLARELGPLRGVGTALQAQALVGSPEERRQRLHESVEAFAGSEARLEQAKALVELGAAIRRGNQPTDSRAPLKEGLELAHSCGATGVVDRAAEELVAAGGRPWRPAQTGIGSLTPAERRVAELAAKGKTNPEIAQDLFVTRKTIETQLGSVYRKLDISSRVQLAGRLS
jgi:DNA-binding CsgD family transcriptional regulator